MRERLKTSLKHLHGYCGSFLGATSSMFRRNTAVRGDFGQEKSSETIRALVGGGGGGNRTPVRRSSTFGTTCLAWSLV